MSEEMPDTLRITTKDDKTCPKELIALSEYLGIKNGEFSEKAREVIHRLYKSLILDKNSLSPQLPTGEQPKSDIPTTNPSLEQRAQTNPALKQALENIKRPTPPPPCNYCGQISETEIECGKPMKEGKKPLKISLASCIACWNRRQWYQKKKKENQISPEEEPIIETLPQCRNLHHIDPTKKEIYCIQYGDWKTYEFCQNCFKGGKPIQPTPADYIEIEQTGAEV